jgi:hypothetical protein
MIGAGSVPVGLILMRIEVKVLVVDSDVSFIASILVISLQIQFVSLFIVHAVVSRLVLPSSARGIPSFLLCEPPHFLSC